MHFAYPPRKDSNAAAFKPRTSRLPLLRRGRARLFTLVGLTVLGLLYLLVRPGRSAVNPWVALHRDAARGLLAQKKDPAAVAEAAAKDVYSAFDDANVLAAALNNFAPGGRAPAVVLVTVYDETNYHRAYLDTVRENRRQYALRHGYATFSPKVGDYDLRGSPLSWTKVVALRHALALFPDSAQFWFLDQNAFVMDLARPLDTDVVTPAALDAAMLKDHPVVPPDSIIRTFGHLRGQDVDFVLTQDGDGLSTASFVVRNGEWARFFLETWYDPLYRSYNFQKAETHALEHIIQWHPTLLSRMALVPQRMLNAYSQADHGTSYEPGDLVVRVLACTRTSSTLCENEAAPFIKTWQQQAIKE